MPFVGVLISWFARFFGPWLALLAGGFLVSLTDWGHDQMVWAFDQLLGLGVDALLVVGGVSGSSDPFTGLGVQTAWASLPVEVLGMARHLWLPQLLAVIIAALGVRFVLQMIPGVRWGSK